MKSHEYAVNLRRLADFLDSRPDFETATEKVYMFVSFYEKEPLVAAVKALGSGTKEFSGDFLYFHPAINDGKLMVRAEAPRNKVCRLVREAEYDCEPLLSPTEISTLAPDADDMPF